MRYAAKSRARVSKGKSHGPAIALQRSGVRIPSAPPCFSLKSLQDRSFPWKPRRAPQHSPQQVARTRADDDSCATMIGQTFTRLTVISEASSRHRKKRWVCSCACGGATTAYQWSLLAGRTRSCGCLKAEELNRRQGHETHGMLATPEYKAWLLMNRRCYDPTYRGFPAYGGSGVTVCPEWRNSFLSFYRDLGRRPSTRHGLVLISGKTFAAGACRWALTRPGAGGSTASDHADLA